MTIKIIKHFTAENNEPAVEYEHVNSSGTVSHGVHLTDGLEGQALIDEIEKSCDIADKFAAAGEIIDEAPYGSLAWRMNVEAGIFRAPPLATEKNDSKQDDPPKPLKPRKAVTSS